MADIKFIALGGQDERGKNLFLIEDEEGIYIFDCGLKYPEKGILGVDVVIPNFDYIKENKDKVKGVFLSNSASYNAGAVVYLLKEFNFKVYCNEITKLVLSIKLDRARVRGKEDNLIVVEPDQKLEFGKDTIETFQLTAASPKSLGFALHTPEGIIVYAGDYIIDGDEKSFYATDYDKISELKKEGVLALIADSEFASRPDYTVPNHKITKFISGPFKEKKLRIAIGIFEEDIFKLGEIVREAKANGRKIAVYGRTMRSILENDMIHSDLNITADDLITPEEYMKSDNGILIVSGTGDALYGKLAKIATGNDDVVEFGPKDLIILATPPAAGVEKRHAQILDELARTDAKLLALSDKNIWSMHASYEDAKMLVTLFAPKYYIPVKALYKEFLKAQQAAIEAGVDEKNIALVDNGQILNISEKAMAVKGKNVPHGDVYVDGTGVGDIGSVVLNERKMLATDGVVIIGATVDSRTKEVVSLIDTQMRGVIYISDENPIFKMMQKEIQTILDKSTEAFKEDPKKYDLNATKREIISKVRSMIKQESGKTPMVLCIINEIDGNFNVEKALQRSSKSRNYVRRATSGTTHNSYGHGRDDHRGGDRGHGGFGHGGGDHRGGSRGGFHRGNDDHRSGGHSGYGHRDNDHRSNSHGGYGNRDHGSRDRRTFDHKRNDTNGSNDSSSNE